MWVAYQMVQFYCWTDWYHRHRYPYWFHDYNKCHYFLYYCCLYCCCCYYWRSCCCCYQCRLYQQTHQTTFADVPIFRTIYRLSYSLRICKSLLVLTRRMKYGVFFFFLVCCLSLAMFARVARFDYLFKLRIFSFVFRVYISRMVALVATAFVCITSHSRHLAPST